MSGVFSGLLQAKPGEFADAEKASGQATSRSISVYSVYTVDHIDIPMNLII